MDQPVTTFIENYSIFNIDNINGIATPINITTANEVELRNFLIRMAANTRSSNSTRKCSFKNNSLIDIYLKSIINDDDPLIPQIKIAEHLAICEADSNNNNPNMKPIKQGSLIVSRITIGNYESIIITKIDIEEFFLRNTMELSSGLPKEKGLLKSFLIDINNDNLDEYFVLADSNTKISSYWRNSFIGGEFFRDDRTNTEEAIKAIRACINTATKTSPEDNTLMQQNFLSYLNTNESYDHSVMIDSVIGNYEPVSSDVNTGVLRNKLTELITREKFDGSFEIDKAVVRDKCKGTFKLDDNIVIKANNGTENIFQTNIKGQNYVVIKTDTGYTKFKKLVTTET
jgi:hypothetical protein